MNARGERVIIGTMRPFHLSLLLFALTATAASALWAADEASLPAKLHPWGQFQPGARSMVRVTTETYNDQDQVVGTSVSDTTTTLVGVDKDGVTLEIDSCVEVVGKRFDGRPQTIKQGFHGELLSKDTKLSAPSDSQVVVDRQKIPCKVQQVECHGANGKTVTRIYYSTTVAPYVFKRESVSTDPDGKVSGESSMEVTSLEMPWNVLGELMSVVNVKTVRRCPKGTVTALEIICPEVPGGVVSRSSREVDASGRLVHRSVLELMEYSTRGQRHSLFPRKSRPRRQKAASRYEQ